MFCAMFWHNSVLDCNSANKALRDFGGAPKISKGKNKQKSEHVKHNSEHVKQNSEHVKLPENIGTREPLLLILA